MLKSLVRKLLPECCLRFYHLILAHVAAAFYGHPSRRLVVIGVTGTSGKTTTCYLLAKILEAGGAKTGMLTTAMFKIGDETWENRTKMTMLGRFQLQKWLRHMADAGCRYAVIETTSQGILQHRHVGIRYDVVVFTNLWPEHVEAHRGFEHYKQAKVRLFAYAAHLPHKTIEGKRIPRVELLNAGSPHAESFVMDGFDTVVRFGAPGASFVAEDVRLETTHSTFRVRDTPVTLPVSGVVNVENALAALAAASVLGVSVQDAAQTLASIHGLPGRYERIEEGQPFVVIVDYAFEPVAMEKLYDLVVSLPHTRVIHVLGSTGGGRDAARRPILGRMAAQRADLLIITNEDPYDEDPRQIMEQVAAGARAVVQEGRSVDLRIVEDRGQAIREAINAAGPQDVVLITGKGSEPVMAVANGKKIPWDDRAEARAALRQRQHRV